MRALIAVASKHGSTWEIGSALASELREAGVAADLLEARDVTSLDDYDIAIIGSAVYVGHWMSEAKNLFARFESDLASMPVWAFSSGPIGADDPKPHGDGQDLADLALAVQARGHHNFAGRLDKKSLNIVERLAAGMVHAPEGDFRDWAAINAWAQEIATALSSTASAR